MSIYDYSFINNAGETVEMSQFRDKVILIVNVASKCGLTSQYAALESLYKKYKEKGLEIIGFPCNQFAGQEPGSDEEIKDFCQTNFDVTFTLASKIDVNGEDAHPIYKYLKNISTDNADIRWNFEKFLIFKNEAVRNFDPQVAPEELEKIIQDGTE
jgi:glutathione peroxidase